MTYDSVSGPLRAFLGTYEVLRRLGFKPDDIYFSTNKSARYLGRLSVFCVLKAQKKEFNIECGFIENEDAARLEYTDVTQRMLKGELPEKDHRRMFEECEAFRMKVDLIMAIMNKGFRLPTASNSDMRWS